MTCSGCLYFTVSPSLLLSSVDQEPSSPDNSEGPSKINTHSPSNPPTNTINDIPSLSPSNKVSITPTISPSSDPTTTLSTTPSVKISHTSLSCVDKEGFIEMGLVQGIVIEKTCEWLATKVSISTRKKKCKKWPKVNSHCYMTCSGCLYFTVSPSLLLSSVDQEPSSPDNSKGPSKINTHSPSNPPTNTINDIPSLSPSNKVS